MGEQTVCRLPERRNDPLHVHRVEVYERFTSWTLVRGINEKNWNSQAIPTLQHIRS